MGRSDVGRLKLPDDYELSTQEPEKPQDVPEKTETPAIDVAIKKPALEVCPHCGTRLSPLDLKMNKCFRCWALLDEENAMKSPAGRTNFEVHI